MFIDDLVRGGYLPLRHHSRQFDIPLRYVKFACRVGGLDLGHGEGIDEYGHARGESNKGPYPGTDETHGDLNCASWWDFSSESGNADALRRDIPGWAFAWPTMIAGTGLNPEPGDFSLTVSALDTPDNLPLGQPIYGKDHQRDLRFKQKELNRSLMYKYGLPKNFPGITIAGTKEHEQDDIFFPAGHAIVAPHWNGAHQLGTPVFDLQVDNSIDYQRFARIQTHFRVTRVPSTCRGDTFGNTRKYMLTSQWGISKGAISHYGAFSVPLAGGGTQEKPKEGDPQMHGTQYFTGGGPVCLGQGANDKHYMGSNADGEPFIQGHLTSNALFWQYGDRCAPLAFGGNWPDDVGSFPEKSEVYLVYDKNSSHAGYCGTKKGLWRWYTTVPTFPIIEIGGITEIIVDGPVTPIKPTNIDSPVTPINRPPPPTNIDRPPPPTPIDSPVTPINRPGEDPGTPQIPGGGGTVTGGGPLVDPGGKVDGPNDGGTGFDPGGVAKLPPKEEEPYEPSIHTNNWNKYTPETYFRPTASGNLLGPENEFYIFGADVDQVDRITEELLGEERRIRRNTPDSSSNVPYKPNILNPNSTIPGNSINLNHLVTFGEMATNGLLFWPGNTSPTVPDSRNRVSGTQISSAEVRKVVKESPIIGRFEPVAAQEGENFDYNYLPGQSKYPGGSAPGTLWFTPGEVSAMDVINNWDEGITKSTARLGVYNGVIGIGTPLVNGKIGSGVELSLSGTDLIATKTNADGSAGTTKNLTGASGSACPCVPGLYGDGHAS